MLCKRTQLAIRESKENKTKKTPTQKILKYYRKKEKQKTKCTSNCKPLPLSILKISLNFQNPEEYIVVFSLCVGNTSQHPEKGKRKAGAKHVISERNKNS